MQDLAVGAETRTHLQAHCRLSKRGSTAPPAQHAYIGSTQSRARPSHNSQRRLVIRQQVPQFGPTAIPPLNPGATNQEQQKQNKIFFFLMIPNKEMSGIFPRCDGAGCGAFVGGRQWGETTSSASPPPRCRFHGSDYASFHGPPSAASRARRRRRRAAGSLPRRSPTPKTNKEAKRRGSRARASTTNTRNVPTAEHRGAEETKRPGGGRTEPGLRRRVQINTGGEYCQKQKPATAGGAEPENGALWPGAE